MGMFKESIQLTDFSKWKNTGQGIKPELYTSSVGTNITKASEAQWYFTKGSHEKNLAT